MRRKIQAAYEQPTYEKAKAALKKVRSELALQNQSAAKSLDEGLEETLTRLMATHLALAGPERAAALL